MEYEIVIGIEVHAELKTAKKLFANAPNVYGAPVNEKTTAYCTAQPGTLPVLNRNCIDLALTAALALNCTITKYMEFDRKNYFYPDIAKGYQITQDRTPIGTDGRITFDVDGKEKTVNIERLHIEEDTAKSIHLNDDTLLDFNRSGSPLIEIVSDASISSPKEATRYIEELRKILLFSGVSDVRMEEGSMRCDANISIRKDANAPYGTKVEIKNLNSISKVEKSLLFEYTRQKQLLDNNEVIVQETKRFDDLTGETVTMRIKETVDDYRYHHDPNLPPVILTDAYIAKISSNLPELPAVKIKRYIEEYQLDAYDAKVLTNTVELSNLFEECIALGANAKLSANIIMGDLSAHLNKYKVELNEIAITSQNIFDLVSLYEEEVISSKILKQVLMVCIEQTIDVRNYVETNGLVQISSEDELAQIVDEVLQANEQSVNDYLSGNKYAFKYLVGQVMKATKGKANPKKVTELINSKL